MQEKFINHIWKLQCFEKKNLNTDAGDSLQIIDIGEENINSGPDFLNAKILINNVMWHGHVELHTNASDWYLHNHHLNKAYNNVILHVVWNNDKPIVQENRSRIPTIELKNAVKSEICESYNQFEQKKIAIPCSNFFQKVAPIIKNGMLDKALYQRIENKHYLLHALLSQNNGDWQETTYQLLAYNLGSNLNSDNFLNLAKAVSLKSLMKKSDSIIRLEALLFGSSGILELDNMKDPYIENLKKEYELLLYNKDISNVSFCASQWKFFRLRPANFPTIRIAQLAQIIHKNPNLFDVLTNASSEKLYEALKITQSTYWQEHYTFGRKASSKIPGLGSSSIEKIIINTVVPLLITYGKAKNNQDYIDRAMEILERLPAEKNKIIGNWAEIGLKVKNAFDSQASIELYNNFCLKKNCLKCDIGLHILNRK